MPITLRCQVQGKHEPTISWHKDNKSLDTDHVILRRESIRIRKAVTSDQGTYACVARNSIGKVEIRDAKVSVSPGSYLPEGINYIIELLSIILSLSKTTKVWSA